MGWDSIMSNLVNHARRELELRGDDEETIEGILKVIQAFADMGPSGGMAAVLIPTINALLQFQNLKPLTDDPAEWNYIGGGFTGDGCAGDGDKIWQSNRNPEAFSNNGGKTYYLLSEGGNDQHREPLHTSDKKEVSL
jgi:hypothetical protein